MKLVIGRKLIFSFGTNLQAFGFEFHMWSLSCVLSRQLVFVFFLSVLVTLGFSLLDPERSKQLSTIAIFSFNFSLDSFMSMTR